MSAAELADPRSWSAVEDDDGFATRLYTVAQHAIDAPTRREADALDATARRLLDTALAGADGRALECALRKAPSPALARHLRRLLADIECGDPITSVVPHATLFAIPVIVVAALEPGAQPITLQGVLPDPRPLAHILREARAFGGCETFGVSTAMTAADAIDIAALPALLARARVAGGGEATFAALDLPPAPIDVPGGSERVHLRFIAGAALTPPRMDPLAESNIARWGIALATAIASGLRAPGVSLLAVPRPAQRLVIAVQAGRAAQREMAAQVFASNALRKFRASYGEPSAIVSAHRAADAAGGGELRLSLSSPFVPKEAEGFRCPVYPYETVQDVGAMIAALLRDCRVSDVRFVPGVHEDVDPITGGPLFLKAVDASLAQAVH